MAPVGGHKGLPTGVALLQGCVAGTLLGASAALLALAVLDIPIAAQGMQVAAIALLSGIWFCPNITAPAAMRVAASVVWSIALPLTIAAVTAAATAITISHIALPVAAAILTLLVASLMVALADAHGWREARTGLVLLLAISMTSCLWLGPAAELAAAKPWMASLIVNLNPATFLAVADGHDYLLDTWLYQHAAFGSLRYQYWPLSLFVGLNLVAALTIAACLLLPVNKNAGSTAAT
jgi:hypothetical protein